MPEENVLDQTAEVQIGGKKFTASPLKMKHLRQITGMLQGKMELSSTPGLFGALEKFMPFVLDCIKTNNPNFSQEDLEEASLGEFHDAWQKICLISGVKISSKGEAKPAKTSSGGTSTDDSAPPPAGPTVM